MHMNPGKSLGNCSVRERAREYEKSKKRVSRTWDESADAVPMVKRRESSARAVSDTSSAENRARNPYRVRESMAKASKKRAAAVRGTPLNRTSPPKAVSAAKPKRVGNGDASRAEYASDIVWVDDVQRVADYRQAVRRKLAHSVIRAAAAVLIVSVCLVCALAIIYKAFYVIKDVSVEGTTLYDTERILSASGIRTGNNLYSFSSRVAEENITLHCPYVSSVAVDRTAPGGVHLTLSEDRVAFYADVYGQIFALSPSLRVLGAISKAQANEEGLIRLLLPAVDEAISGRVVRFTDERQARVINEIVSASLASSLCDRITVIDLRDTHSLRMICDGQYLLKIGDASEIDVKLKVANAVMADALFSSVIKAQIDLTVSGETSVVLDNQLNLDW